ncbi:hypothetical protein DL98DRAFT_541215, partial [Cadophora sp. DSE1049]
KIIIGIRYSQENKRNFDIQVKALEIKNPRLPQLEGLKEEINDPNFTDAINRGLIKLRKYYPKTGNTSEKNKSLYLALILDPRIKQEGLEVIGLSRNQAFDIYHRLEEVYNIFKVDFALANPPIEEALNLALEDSDDDSDIYIQEDEINELSELDRYFQEPRANKAVN